ncbi:YceI family protein [Cesiribacter sp. SM1]|uniref:YceI family protein n=1 Tax=Cesiribacter sp. SM1 TaxID=2861196 RepID=UPI001CD1AD3F|nr:YceI family protein [Cesiribacter sp. SM1]
MKKSLVMLMTACSIIFASCEKSDLTTNTAVTDTEQPSNNRSENSARENFSLDSDKSVVEWWGSGPDAAHHGSFSVSAQNIEIVNGKVKQGRFIIPIASIQNFDLPDNIKPVLLDHLKSADFFNMALYPEASFDFRKVTPITKAVAGAVEGANYMVSGDFTMLGKAIAISFPARIVVNGEQLAVEAKLKIDRTQWGMNYAADPNLGAHHIYPNVDLHLKLIGQKQ